MLFDVILFNFFICYVKICQQNVICFVSAVLVLYLTSILQYDDDQSTIIYHMVVFLAYFSPLFGAIISDSYWGKFKYEYF